MSAEERAAWDEYLETCTTLEPPKDENGRCAACLTIDGHLVACPSRFGYRGVEPWAWSQLRRRLAREEQRAAVAA